MGSGESGRYYTSRGSSKIHHQALIHSIEGNYTKNPKTGKIQKLINGGHGQDAIDFMKKKGLNFEINKTFKNGVRVGNVKDHKNKSKQKGNNQSWFPKSWTQKDVTKAAEHVVCLKHNKGTKDGITMWGKFKGVWVGVKKTHGNIATVFPDRNQSDKKKRR